jgi:hypothetical protein
MRCNTQPVTTVAEPPRAAAKNLKDTPAVRVFDPVAIQAAPQLVKKSWVDLDALAKYNKAVPSTGTYAGK